MTLGSKIILIISGILLLSAVGFIIYQQFEMKAMQTQINSSLVAQQTLLDGITRSSAQYVTKQDLDAFAQQNNVNLATIQQNVSTLNATISGMNQVVANSSAQTGNNLPSTGTTPNPTPTPSPTVSCNGQQIPCPNTDPYGYQSNQQTLQLNEDFTQPAATAGGTPSTTQVPIGSASFSAWQKAPWSVNILPRTYDITNVLATDPTGKQYVYNQFSISADGKSYTVPITTAKFVQQYPSATFSFWNPRLFLTAGGGVDVTHLGGSGNAGVALGIMSYGQTKPSPSISVLQVGAVYETGTQRPALVLNPISFNLKGLLPTGLVDNTFVGPSVQVDTAGNVFGGLNLDIGF